MAEDQWSCSHRLIASALRMCIPLGLGGSVAQAFHPWIVGRLPLKVEVGPQPSSQILHFCGSSAKCKVFLCVPCSRRSPGAAAMSKSHQKRRSRFAAHTGPAGIFVGRPAKCSEMMLSGSLSITTFSMMCRTTMRLPAACLTISRMRVASKKRIESLLFRFSLLFSSGH